MKPIVYHIPVCPFSQRLEILLTLKGKSDSVTFRTVDVTKLRDPALLALSRGSTALPIMETKDGVIKESLVLLRYLDEALGPPFIAAPTAEARAIENMLIALEGGFVAAGYRFLLNQDQKRRQSLCDEMLAQFGKLQDFLSWQNPDGTFLFDEFGLAEVVFTPFFVRFLFLAYYEGFDLPATGFERLTRWRKACLAHPAAQQVSEEEVIKLYYDYAQGVGNGGLVAGRTLSSFVFTPHWSKRPWPPRDKRQLASDADLGLLEE